MSNEMTANLADPHQGCLDFDNNLEALDDGEC